MLFACIWLSTFVWKKHDHSQGKPLIGCICHLIVLKGRSVVIYYMYGLVNSNVPLRQL